jgi:pimeloyl-ACP methyl ester carboxylesterase
MMGPWYNFSVTEHNYLHPNGTIPYLEDGNGPNLLFLHGAFAMPQAYKPLLTLLSLSFHVIAPTHPGHGRSLNISSLWSYADYIQTYEEFIEKLEFSPSVIVGHSFGGALSLSLGSMVKNVCIIAMDSVGLPFPFIVKDFLTALLEEGDDAFKKDPNMQTLQELGRAAGALAVTFGKHPENIPWFYRHGSTLDLSETLSSFSNPLGLLWGEHDRVVPLSVGERIKTLVPQAILKTYPGFEHNYPITQPEFTYKEVMEMVSYLGMKK